MKDVEIEWDRPVANDFPDLTGFKVLIRRDGRFLLRAGTLGDGLIVPLFHSDAAAEAILGEFAPEDPHFDSRPQRLGDAFLAMRKGATDGAAGFQLVLDLPDDECQTILEQTQGRVLFPFMLRFEEAGSLWPTVLGSATRCDKGCYLTRQGQRCFGKLELMQWVRWDIMDHASSEMRKEQPFRSHEPGEKFFALPCNDNALVFFAKDNVLRGYAPPEGYIPVFTSLDSAERFLNERQGGAFHVLQVADREKGSCGAPRCTFLHALDAAPGSSLATSILELDNLPAYICYIREKFSLPYWSKFVINPFGHREDSAWGFARDADAAGLLLKSVSGRWNLTKLHEYSLNSYVDWFTSEDTFYRGTVDFRFSHLGRSFSAATDKLGGHKLSELSDLELNEVLTQDLVATDLQELLDSRQQGPFPGTAIDRVGLWNVVFWDTVTGQTARLESDSPFGLAKFIACLEGQDRQARVSGSRQPGYVGFEGSGSQELEDATGQALIKTLLKICARIARQGYRPQDSLDMVGAANHILKLYRIATTGVAADMLLSFVDSEVHPLTTIYDALGIDFSLRPLIEQRIDLAIDPEAEQLLIAKVSAELVDTLLPRTKLFLSTALLQLKNSGQSPCLDYAPMSVEVVKGLEHQIRQLYRDHFPTIIEHPSQTEKTIVKFITEDKFISLSELVKSIHDCQSAQSGGMHQFHKNLCTIGVPAIITGPVKDFVLEDVIKRYRNGGAHEHRISFQTCQECVEKLIGSQSRPGLIFQITQTISQHRL